MAERARIARFFAPLTATEPGSFQLMDDAARLSPPPGSALVITTDSVIQGIHVLADATPTQYAQKLVRRNLSDIAAMGAAPWRYTLNLHTPAGLGDDWFADFAATLDAEQRVFGMVLIGGDSTAGGDVVHTTMTCFGLTDGEVLRRAGAQVGDDIYVSGAIGGAIGCNYYSICCLLARSEALIARYHMPQPRIALGQALRGIAHACIDISDGLLADVAQLCAASGVGVQIRQMAIPLSIGVQQLLRQKPALWDTILHGGDDYELCFTASSAMRAQLAALAEELGVALTRIGTVTQAPGLVVLDAHGVAMPISSRGWEYA